MPNPRVPSALATLQMAGLALFLCNAGCKPARISTAVRGGASDSSSATNGDGAHHDDAPVTDPTLALSDHDTLGDSVSATDAGDASAHQDDDGDGLALQSDAGDPLASEPEPPAGDPLAGDLDPGPILGTLVYQVTFESGTIVADVGTSRAELKDGGSITAVANPEADARNGSAWVGKHTVPAGYTRAELSSQRLITREHAYTYRWSVYRPDSFATAQITWQLMNQWKSYPCGNGNGWADEICEEGGIFDEVRVFADRYELRLRAAPACDVVTTRIDVGEWTQFELQVYWTNTETGYARFWKNGELIYDRHGFKTLFDRFEDTTCDLYWAVGLYADSGGLELYSDNLEIWTVP